MNTQEHKPVLLAEVLKYLSPKEQDSYLDLTAGYGGHALEVIKLTQASNKAVLVDRDQEAFTHLEKLDKLKGAKLLRQDFLSASRNLAKENRRFNLILADLGVSSPHLNNISRGFSISLDGPLDMRMDRRSELNAQEIINKYPVDKLAKILKEYGEEPRAHKIAAAIVKNRPLSTTGQLAEAVKRGLPKAKTNKRPKVHPATRTFQAIRIAVNDELNQLKEALPLMFELLAEEGRIVIISFHSLEDRLVKNAMNSRAGNRYDATLRLLTQKPVTPGQKEIAFNPRARSAKLRAAAKIKTSSLA